MYACNGILFNHESPTRGETFLTRKVTRGLTRIHLGMQDCLYMGNLDSLRDWGHAREYVEMQWLMLQQEQPEDFVIATGQQASVREFINKSAKALGLKLSWEGSGLEETATVIEMTKTTISNNIVLAINVGDIIVRIDERYYRPAEVESLLGDPTRAHTQLGWAPKIGLDDLVNEMMFSDLENARRHALLATHGFDINPPKE